MAYEKNLLKLMVLISLRVVSGWWWSSDVNVNQSLNPWILRLEILEKGFRLDNYLARPKSATFATPPLAMRTFLAAKSR